MSATHSLVEIPRCDWPKLRDLYVNRQTQSTGYNSIDNFISWVEHEPNEKITCLALNGDWQTDGTFIMIDNFDGLDTQLYLNTLDENQERLTAALKCLELRTEKYSLYGYGKHLIPAIAAFEKEMTGEEQPRLKTIWYHASKDQIVGFATDPPTGITLANLRIEDAEQVNENWPHAFSNSIEFVKRMIRYNVNIGAYDEAGKLIAWSLRLPSGSLGLLQVMESHKRLGLGSLMVRCLSKKISALGGEVMAPVVVKNTASSNMFEKLGFRPIDEVYWSKV